MATVKLVVLGGSGVGKSSVTLRFVQDKFETDYNPTIENSFQKPVQINGKQVKLEILDTAGTEQFAAMRELYIRNGQGFILVYSIISRGTFNVLPDLIKQIHNIKAQEEHKMVILANKCDLQDERVVTKEEGEQLAKDNGARFYETSARAKINVDQAFTQIAEDIIGTGKTDDSEKKGGCCLIL